MWQIGYWDYNLDHACAEYGGCGFVSVCKSPSPEDWLPMYFEKRVWDPLARKETTVEEWEASWGHTVEYAKALSATRVLRETAAQPEPQP